MPAENDWVQTFQGLVNHLVPPMEGSPALSLSAASLVFVAAGLVMALRGGKLLRWLVTFFGLVIGTWVGIELAGFVGTPRPITAAVCGLGVSIIAYRTYKMWLVGGSVVVLFVGGLCYELGEGDLTRYVRDQTTEFQDDMIGGLPTPEEQKAKYFPTRTELMQRLGRQAWSELESLGPTGWILPLGAAIVGGLLAWKALTIFAIVWIGFVGAMMTVLGAFTFLGAHWANLRMPMMDNPQILAGVVLVLWIGGLILQAKEARIPAAAAKPEGGDSKKS